VIPPDDSDATSLNSVRYHIPDPKAQPIPPDPSVPSTTHVTIPSPLHTVVSHDLDNTTLEATALQPLPECLLASIHSDQTNLHPTRFHSSSM
jgi:hypothetical protein